MTPASGPVIRIHIDRLLLDPALGLDPAAAAAGPALAASIERHLQALISDPRGTVPAGTGPAIAQQIQQSIQHAIGPSTGLSAGASAGSSGPGGAR